MELIILIAIIWGIYWLFSKGSNSSRTDSAQSYRQSQSYQPRTTSKPQVPKSTETFRPTQSRRKSSNITFRSSSDSPTQGAVPVPSDLSGLHDAFTGAPLQKSLGLFQCQSCKVFYHSESVQVLREANNSQCVSCQSTNIISVVPGAAPSGGRDYTPSVVTLANVRDHVGSVVTFEGHVHKVNESRRGNDFAVMFENKSWVRGFKLVFFRGAVSKVGGKRYINSLKGKTVRVRGLIVNHERFGYEIIVSEKSMIISVS